MNSKTFLLFPVFIYILLSISGCNQNADTNKLSVINFDDISAIDLKHEIPLDSIIERTEIIRFTSDSDLIIGNISAILESRDNFFVVAENQIAQFTKAGEFIRQIGKQGKGPGEYLSPQAMDVDEANQQLFVMDYFGRKMLVYGFDGSFDKKFDLPENFNINGFSLYNGKILYTSVANAVIPELYIYDLDIDELTEISSPEREMLAGEALMSSNFIMDSEENPSLFHYLNDTVYSVKNSQLVPEYLLQFGKLKIKFDELNVESGKKADGPRAQVYNMVKCENFTFVQYGVTRLENKTGQTYLTGIFKNDFSIYTPNVTLVNRNNRLFTIQSGKGFYKGFGNTLLVPVSALEVLKTASDFDISEEDNPIVLKYYLL